MLSPLCDIGLIYPKRALAANQVLDIRNAYASGSTTFAQLASEYGVSAGTIDNVVNRKTYKWV